MFGGVLLVYLVFYFAAPPVYSSARPGTYRKILARGDGHYIYLNTLSLGLDRDLQLRDEYRQFGDPYRMGDARKSTSPTGREWIFPVGPAVLQLPGFLLAHGIAAVANVFGADIPMHGYTLWHQRITFLVSLLAGFCSLVLGFLLAQRHASRTAALYGVVVVGLGSGLLFYSAYRGSYSHVWSAFAVALFVEYWDRTRGQFRLSRFAWMGAMVGLVGLARMQDVTVAVLPVVETAIQFASRARRREYRGAAFLALAGLVATVTAFIVVSPQLIATKVFFGGYFALPQGDNFMRWEAPFFWEVLFSTRNGLFVWTPLLYFASLGLLAGTKSSRTLAGALAAVFFMQLWICGSTWSWWGDASFGARRLMGVTVVWVVGVAFFVDRIRSWYATFPRVMPHVAAAGLLLPFLVMNSELSCAVSEHEQRVGAVEDSGSLYGHSFTRLKNKFGNPFSWPYNWYWSASNDAPLARYDRLVGGELLKVNHRKYGHPGVETRAKIKTSRGHMQRYFIFGDWHRGRLRGAEVVAWGRDGSRVLVPLFLTEDITFVVRARSYGPQQRIQFSVNGELIGESTLTSKLSDTELRVPTSALEAGTNELVVECNAERDSPCIGVQHIIIAYSAGSGRQPAFPR